jgi:hypothetical protein
MHSDTYPGVSKYIISVFNLNELRYKVLDNVMPDGTYSFSFNEMTPYEQKVTFSFPPSNNVGVFTYGSEPDPILNPNAYMLTLRYISNTTNTIEIGYINSLTNYKTELVIFYPGYMYRYLNQGSIPEGNVTWPQKSDFNVVEKSLSNFSATSSKSYVWRNSVWGSHDIASKTFVEWAFAAPSGNQKINEMPAEILNVHPVLSLGNLEYAGTTFYAQSPAYELTINRADVLIDGKHC